MKKRIIAIAALVLAMCMLFAACSGGSAKKMTMGTGGPTGTY